MNRLPSARAELVFNGNWSLSPAGTAFPLRYWAHAHFTEESARSNEEWTMFVDLDEAPIEGKNTYVAIVSFMAPSAPHHYLKPHAEFVLSVGEMIKARGIIKSLVADE